MYRKIKLTKIFPSEKYSFALQIKASNDDKNVLIFYFHVDNDNVCEALRS